MKRAWPRRRLGLAAPTRRFVQVLIRGKEVASVLGIFAVYLGLMCYLRARGVKEWPEGEE